MSELQELHNHLAQSSTIGIIFAVTTICFLFGLIFCRQQPIMRHGWPAYLLSVVWVSIVPVLISIFGSLVISAAALLGNFMPRVMALLVLPIWLFSWLSITVWLICRSMTFPLEFALRNKELNNGCPHRA